MTMFVRNVSWNRERQRVEWNNTLVKGGLLEAGDGQDEYYCLSLEKGKKPLEGFKELRYKSGKEVRFFSFVYF